MAPPTPILNVVQEQIQQLTTAVQAFALQQEDYYINVHNVHRQENSDINPFAEHEVINPMMIMTIDQSFPEFHGGQSPEELLDWIITVEETLEVKGIPLERCAPMVATRFRGRAAAWWSQHKASRTRLGKPRILSWDNLKKKLRKAFLPFNYDQVMFQRQQGNRSVEVYYTVEAKKRADEALAVEAKKTVEAKKRAKEIAEENREILRENKLLHILLATTLATLCAIVLR